jgi:hypothetical protein
MALPGVVPNELAATVTVAVACGTVGGTVRMVVSVSSSVSSSPLANALYMLLVYPFWPVVLQSSMAVRRLPYASWKNVFRAGYVLMAVASHVSNSLRGNMLDVARIRIAFAIICYAEYGTCPIRWTSWHCSRR